MLNNYDLLINYLPIVIFLAIAVAISTIVISIPLVLAKQKPQEDKLKEYECGFDSSGNSRAKFDVRFYLVAILFIIFDLEVAFLIPWAMKLKTMSEIGFYSMMFFLLLLTIGFIYEWKRGALDW